MATTEERLDDLESAMNSVQSELLKRASNAAVNALEDARDVKFDDQDGRLTKLKSDMDRVKAQLMLLTKKIQSGFARDDVTIASGAFTVPSAFFLLQILDVETQDLAASDNLDTINGGQEGSLLILLANHDDRTVVVKDGTGNLHLSADFSLTNTKDTIMLVKVGSVWQEISRSDNTT